MPYSKERRDEAIRSGGIPFNPFPGEAAWLFRQVVESGGPVLKSLCGINRDRELEILTAWCRHAKTDAWAWDEARTKLDDLLARGEIPPAPLARFAIVPRPSARRGPDPDAARSARLELMVLALQDEGLVPGEVVEVFTDAFPGLGRQHADSTLRKRRGKGKPYVVLAESTAAQDQDADVHEDEDEGRAVALDYDWSEPAEAARVLLASGWPAFALIWEFWPGRGEENIAHWCTRAKGESWVWDEVRALLDHAAYCQWSRPPVLNAFVSSVRPTNPGHRPPEYGRGIRLAAIERKLEEQGQSRQGAQLICLEAFNDLGFDLDDSTVRRNLISGRERLEGLIA